jgi:hypothetical protein
MYTPLQDLGFDIADSLRDNVYPPAVSESTTDIYNESNTFSPSDVGSSIPSVNPIDIQQILFPTASEFNALDMSPVGVNRETQALPSHQPLVNPRAIDALIGMTPGKLDKRTLKVLHFFLLLRKHDDIYFFKDDYPRHLSYPSECTSRGACHV